jgi:peptide-methionine (R)-S-oxide reductase
MKRRHFLTTAALAFAGARAWANGGASFEITRSEAEWRARLSDAEFRVMRKEDTERAGSSPLDAEKRAGLYLCKGCDLPVYSSAAKFDSGTGWPSFYESLPDAVRTSSDRKLLFLRTEVHCRRCGSHFGHIFDDGPPPTGKRHCLNGLSLRFEPGAA